MQVSVEATEGLERKMTVEIPAERVDSEIESRLKSLARSVRIDGFRPGKVPFKVIKGRFGGQVREEVADELIQSTFQEAVSGQQLRLAGSPAIEERSLEDGLRYTARFEVYPEVALAPFDQVAVKRPQAEVTEADLDAMMEKLRKQRVAWKDVERAAQNDDRVIIDFTGSIDGEEFAGGSATNTPVVLGSKSMIEGFEEQLVGAKAGDDVSVTVTFPADYRAEHLAGKAATFAVKVHSVSEPELPALDDAFAAAFEVKEGGIEALRAEVKNNMERELRQAIRRQVKDQVLDGLVVANPVDLPGSMVDGEIDVLRAQAQQQAPQGMRSQNLNLPRELFEEQAKKRVALGILVMEIVKTHGIQVDPQRVRAAVEEQASAYENPAEVINWYYSNRQYLARVENAVLEDQVVEWIAERAQVEEVPSSFDQVMNPGQA